MNRRLAALMVTGLVLASCADAARVSGVDPGSGRRIDQVRLGFGLDPEGRVSRGCTARGFALGDPIHLSLQVTDAREGELLNLTVRDAATQQVAWSEQRPMPPGRSVQTFEIGTELAEGRYRAEPALGGGGTPIARDFDVHARRPS